MSCQDPARDLGSFGRANPTLLGRAGQPYRASVTRVKMGSGALALVAQHFVATEGLWPRIIPYKIGLNPTTSLTGLVSPTTRSFAGYGAMGSASKSAVA